MWAFCVGGATPPTTYLLKIVFVKTRQDIRRFGHTCKRLCCYCYSVLLLLSLVVMVVVVVMLLLGVVVRVVVVVMVVVVVGV